MALDALSVGIKQAQAGLAQWLVGVGTGAPASSALQALPELHWEAPCQAGAALASSPPAALASSPPAPWEDYTTLPRGWV